MIPLRVPIGTVVLWRSSLLHAVSPHLSASPRYHLYVSYACPRASRCLSVLGLKGIGRDVVSVSSVHPTWAKTRPDDVDDAHCGWRFWREDDDDDATVSNPAGVGAFPGGAKYNCTADDLHGVTYVRDLYDMVNAPKGTRFTVPILWDKKTNSIVSNESADIIRDLYTQFDAFAKNPDLDLYPEALRDEIDAVNEWVYHGINNGVYKSGFATSQARSMKKTFFTHPSVSTMKFIAPAFN